MGFWELFRVFDIFLDLEIFLDITNYWMIINDIIDDQLEIINFWFKEGNKESFAEENWELLLLYVCLYFIFPSWWFTNFQLSWWLKTFMIELLHVTAYFSGLIARLQPAVYPQEFILVSFSLSSMFSSLVGFEN